MSAGIESGGGKIGWQLAAIGESEVAGGIDTGMGIEHLFGLSVGVEGRDDDGSGALKVGPEWIEAISEECAIGACLVAGCAA